MQAHAGLHTGAVKGLRQYRGFHLRGPFWSLESSELGDSGPLLAFLSSFANAGALLVAQLPCEVGVIIVPILEI